MGLLNSSQKSTELSKALACDVGPIPQAQRGAISTRVPTNMQDSMKVWARLSWCRAKALS
ncbi:hypothetical protein I79_015917 [Cricetulus griseus]|uniref:Uncharacterized protein n=1 Tax=Cricetulus griseus TaxID=10029 RepID=G3HY18_CRIGR|nr:hypothetical protein I79_015917 [Cricetulus griseus]